MPDSTAQDDIKYLIHENDQLRALFDAAIRQRDDARFIADKKHQLIVDLRQLLTESDARAKQYYNELEMIVVLGREQGVTLGPAWVARIAALIAAKEQTDGNT